MLVTRKCSARQLDEIADRGWRALITFFGCRAAAELSDESSSDDSEPKEAYNANSGENHVNHGETESKHPPLLVQGPYRHLTSHRPTNLKEIEALLWSRPKNTTDHQGNSLKNVDEKVA